jgi:hypothetical protein
MDPITAAAKEFLAQLERFWKPARSAPIPSALRVVRVVVAPSDRGDVLKALRWLEWSPENRRPVVLFEDAFEDEARWLWELVAKLAGDCDSVRQGLTEDGILLPIVPTRPSEAAIDTATARRYVEAAAEALVTEALDGLVIALAPRWVADPKAYGVTLAKIAAPPLSAALFLAVLDIPGAELRAPFPVEVRYEVNRSALFAFLKQLGPKSSEGPAISKPSWSSSSHLAAGDESPGA